MTNGDLNELREKIDRQLHELECMSEFAADLSMHLDGDQAPPGFCKIELAMGDRLTFCCVDIKRRIEELRDTMLGWGSQS